MNNRICSTCDNVFLRYISPSALGKGAGKFCSNKCRRISPERKIQISKKLKGKRLSRERRKNMSLAHVGNKHSEETKRKISLAHIGMLKPWNIGENNFKWRGGITSLRKQIWNNEKSRMWRRECRIRDRNTCQVCNQKGGWLEVDHIIPFSYILKQNNIATLEEAILCEELWDLTNGRTLCKPCHKETMTWGEGARFFQLTI